MIRFAQRKYGGLTNAVCRHYLNMLVTALSLSLMLAFAIVVQAQTDTEEKPHWFSYVIDDYTGLGYGIPDNEETDLVFYCVDDIPGLKMTTSIASGHAKDGENLTIYLSATQGETSIPARASTHEMDDSLSVMGTTTLDDTLKNILKSQGTLTVTIAGLATDYPLDGAAEQAGNLLLNCSEKPKSHGQQAGHNAPENPVIEAGFDCGQAQRVVEQFICSRATLRWQDLALSRSYKAAYTKQQGDARKTLVANQRDWLKERDRRCIADRTFQELSDPLDYLGGAAKDCLNNVYITRRQQLQDMAVAPITPLSISELGRMPVASSTLDPALLTAQALWTHGGKGIAPTQHEITPEYWDIIPDMQANANFIVWTDDQGRNTQFLMMRPRQNSASNRVVAWGSGALTSYLFDTSRSLLIYPSNTGILIHDLATGSEWRIAGTSNQDLPYALSADLRQFAWTTHNECGDNSLASQDLDAPKKLCLAQLPTKDAPNTSASDDPWVGSWNSTGVGTISARIRRGTAKPDYLAVQLVTGLPGCSGAVTGYGIPVKNKLTAVSYDVNDPKAPTCTLDLTLDASGGLVVQPYGKCSYYHGGGCTFDGSMYRESTDPNP